MSSTTTTTVTQPSLTVSSEIPIPRGPTQAELIFYSPPADGAVPFTYVGEPPAGQPQKNYGEDTHAVTIHDIRDNEHTFSLDEQGFATVAGVSTSVSVDFDSEPTIAPHYYPEVEQLLLSHVPGAKRVFIFDHTIRRSSPGASRAPVTRAHIDQTAAAVRERVRLHMGDEAAKLLEGRVRLVNVWRPLNGPVVTFPLAYADSRSVGPDHVVGVEHRYPHRTGETAGVRFAEEGKWYYWSGMKNDERVLLQCYDSHGGQRRTPHSAFVDPRSQPDWPGRESIEVRALVFG